MFTYICDECGLKANDWQRCDCGGTMRAPCAHEDCDEAAYDYIYAFGTMRSVCLSHYNAATPAERTNATRFLYAER